MCLRFNATISYNRTTHFRVYGASQILLRNAGADEHDHASVDMLSKREGWLSDDMQAALESLFYCFV